MNMFPASFVLMFWDFYLPPIDECMVSRGCSRLEERGSIYLVDLVAIIEVRRVEVLASTLDGSRLWRRGPGWPGGSELCWELWDRDLDGDILFILYCCYIGNHSRFLVSFPPLDVRPLKAAYSWWHGPIPLLGDRLWVCRVRDRVRQQRRWIVRLRDASLRSRMPVARRIKDGDPSEMLATVA
jgi:hypothetical protein